MAKRKKNQPNKKPAKPAAKQPTKAPSKPIGTGGGGVSKPIGGRAITNGSSPTMRQIRAKAVQKQRMASGKTTVASRTPGPSAATRARISQTAQRMKPIGDSPRVRQAVQQGKDARAAAQTRRNVRAVSQRMTNRLAQARAGRAAMGTGRMGLQAEIVRQVVDAGSVAPGTITAAQGGRAPSRFANARDLAMKKAKAIKGSPVVGPRKSSSGGGGSFDSAFAAARKAGKGTFTWRGKKYNTKMKGE